MPTHYQVSSKTGVTLWLKDAESGSFSNVTKANQGDFITDSDAFKACSEKKDSSGRSLDLTLPTREDYEALLGCFEKSKRYENSLSPSASKEFEALFPPRADQTFFWTASIAPNEPNKSPTVVFLSPPQFSIYSFSGIFQNSVRCVRHLVR